MSTLSALQIADLIKEKAMALTKDQPVEGYEFTFDDETEAVWIIAQADFDYEYGALVQLITQSPRPYIMIWWRVVRNDDLIDVDEYGMKTEVEWIQNLDGSITWTDAISRWGSWISVNMRGR
jgi:hypothetical protein